MSEQTSWIKQTSATHVGLGGQEWWRTSAVYQVYPRSWADSNGDGVGDLPGITAKLPYLRDLGVDALWISPFYTSPMADAGYDVADYRDIDPLFGTLADADKLIARAHELDLRVIVDLVPNHSSDEHEWFKAALAAGPGSPERERYLFRDGKGENGELPPNDWQAIFGGNAWTRVSDADGNPEQWYLHLFDPKQPDFNWNNPEVRDEFVSILTFWLDRGVDGFRVDVAHSLIKADGLPDHAAHAQMAGTGDASHDNGGPMWDQEGVHEIYRAWRELLDSYNPRDADGYDSAADRAMCAEAWVSPPERLARYVRPDEFHQAFNFAFLETPWRAADLHESITSSYRSNDSVGAPTTWVLSNHDVVRHATRLALPVGQPRPNGIAADEAHLLNITVRPLACTATIMHEMMGADAARMPREIKGLMLSCILSDTLAFRSPTTTPHDRWVAEKLAKDLDIAIPAYATEMFTAKSDVSSFSDAALLKMDSKEYELGGKQIRISVLETTAPQVLLDRKAQLLAAVEAGERVPQEAVRPMPR